MQPTSLASPEERIAEALADYPETPSLTDLLVQGTLLLRALQAAPARDTLPNSLRERTEAVLGELLEAAARAVK